MNPESPLSFPLNEIRFEHSIILKSVNDAAKRVVNLVINSAAGLTDDSPAWVCKLRLLGQEGLKDSEVQELIRRESQNVEFLRLLGSLVIDNPTTDAEIRAAVGERTIFLLEHWIKSAPLQFPLGLPLRSELSRSLQFSLCYYSDPAISKLLNWWFGKKIGSRKRTLPSGAVISLRKGLSRDDQRKQWEVRKQWERLGLQKSKHILFGDVEERAGMVTPIPLKKFGQ